MHPSIIKNILFPIHEWALGRKTVKYLKELEEIQWHSSDEIKEFQFKKLKKLLNHAYDNVPFYHKQFKKVGILPLDIKSFDDLRKIPTLTKKEIKEHINELKAVNINEKLIRMNTGGSTGTPLIFYVDKKRVAYDKAANLRSRRWWGIDIGDMEVVLWGSPIELSTQDRLKKLRDFLTNTKLLSAFNMSENTMLKYTKIIQTYKPKHLFGYSSSIYLFSQFLKRNKIDLSKTGLKVIFVTGEVLHDFQRKTIENTFSCPVANGYGGRDGGFIAHQCPEGKMHITEDIYVEFIKDGIPATLKERGEIVITHLDSYGMPFIRYKTGDIGKASGNICPCGRGSEVMEAIEGRTTDFIVTPDGKIMHALSLIYILRDLEGIEQFKIIQKSKKFLLINLIKNNNFSVASEKIIKQKIKELMGEEVIVNLKFVKSIEPEEKSGKFKYVVSDVNLQNYLT